MDKKSIKTLIERVLKELIRRDIGLIHRKVREECINHRLACYLEQFLSEYKCRKYSVDLEYNKNYNDPKRIQIDDKNTKAIRPDIIIHDRENNDNNLIAFEIKKNYTERTLKHDSKKIRGLFRSPYNYKYGCLIFYLPEKSTSKSNYSLTKAMRRNSGSIKINKTVSAHNSGHTATFCFAQIRQSRTSHVRRTLSEIVDFG